jgi:hypothetical protein
MALSAFSVFLSYNRADKSAVAFIARRLQEKGIRTWLDQWNLIPGEPWYPAIEEAISDCTAVAVFLGPSGRSTWQNREMRLAIDRAARVIPVLLPDAARDAEPSFLTEHTWVEFGGSLDDEEAIRLLICGVKGERPGPSHEPETIAYRGKCPYPGLSLFDVDDAHFFCGRQETTAELVEKLAKLPTGHPRLLGIVGTSGSGKSSVARAGLLHALETGAIKRRTFKRLILTPGKHPVMALASALGEISPTPPDALTLKQYSTEIRKEPQMLHLQADAKLGPSKQNALVVLVDQFEQVFSCDEEQDRKAFIDTLLYAASQPSPAVYVILTVRADFYGDCSRYPDLAASLSQSQVLLGAMLRDQLRDAIEKPAAMAGGRVEPALTVALLDDAGQPDCLPLLQFVLQKLWNENGSVLRLADYERMGKLGGALNQHAEDLYKSLDEPSKARAHTILLGLVQPLRDRRYTKIRVPYAELLPAASDPGNVKATEEVAGVLTSGRLLTFSTFGTGGRFVELAHEALIQNWHRFRAWLGKDEEFLLWRQRLRVEIEDWRRFQRDKTTLLQGVRLREAERKQKERGGELNKEDHEYINESRSARRRQYVFRGAQAALVALATLGVFLWYQYRELLGEARTAVARRSDDSVIPAARAFKWLRTSEVKAILEEAVQRAGNPLIEHGEEQRVEGLTFSSDGGYIATAGGNAVRLCGPGYAGCQRPLDLKQPVLSVAFSPDGKHLAAGVEGRLRIWSVPDLNPQSETELPASALAFSPTGAVFAAGGRDGTVRLADAATGREIRSFAGQTDSITRVSFSADDRWIASGSLNGVAMVWPVQGGVPVRIAHEEVELITVEFVARNRLLTATRAGDAFLWTIPDGKQIARTFSKGGLKGAAAGGGSVAIANKSTLSICDPETLRPVLTIRLKEENNVTRVAMTAKGDRVAVATSSGNAYVYELDDEKLLELAEARISELRSRR